MEIPLVGAVHAFHDTDYVRDWARRFAPTPDRTRLFNLILSEIRAKIPETGQVVELGIGPGYLAGFVLDALPRIHYCGIDFSEPMLEIARERLLPHSDRLSFIKADLVADDWVSRIIPPCSVIISTWTLHDLGSPENIRKVYEKSACALRRAGVLMNGDFIKPDGATQPYERGRFGISQHLQLLMESGFSAVACLATLETELVSPTSSQNYACFKAIK